MLNKVHRTTKAQLSKITSYNSSPPTNTGHFHSYNIQKWLPYQILGGKIIKNVKNRSRNNGDMDEKAKRDVMSE